MANLAMNSLTADTGSGSITTDISTFADAAEHSITGIERTSNMLIVVENTAVGASKTFTIKASTAGFPQYLKGDATFEMTKDNPSAITVEGARFLQADGTITFTIDSGTTGTISAIGLPD